MRRSLRVQVSDRCDVLAFAEHMGVDPQRGGRIRVPEPLGDLVHRDPGAQPCRGGVVAQVVDRVPGRGLRPSHILAKQAAAELLAGRADEFEVTRGIT